MGLPVEVNNLMLGSLGGYTVGRSLRFRSSASAYLQRTNATTGTDPLKFTVSGWMKRGLSSASYFPLVGSDTGSNAFDFIGFSGDNFAFRIRNSSSVDLVQLVSTAVFRDFSAWYHFVAVYDSANATSTERVKLYVNGVQITAFATATYPSLNQAPTGGFLTDMQIGRTNTNNVNQNYGDGYLAEVNFIDGQALTPSSFGAYDTNGVWQPKKYTGTYGTNGFYLPFSLNTTATYDGSFNGSNQSIGITANSNFAFTTGNFTAECWFNSKSVASQNTLIDFWSNTSPSFITGQWQLQVNTSSQLVWFVATGSSTSTSIVGTGASITLNTWNHAAVVRNGTTVTLYLNGVSVGSGTFSGTVGHSTGNGSIGRQTNNSTQFMNGNISNVRITNTAVYTSAFTPDSTPLTAISGTKLLTLQNSTLVDNSGNSITLTNNNTVTFNVAYPFSTGTSISNDASGNGNNWTPNNISLINGTTYDSMIDSPTNSANSSNYAVINPLMGSTEVAFSNANLKVAGGASTNFDCSYSSIGMTSGKWYAEFTVTLANNATQIGVGSYLYPRDASNMNGNATGITMINLDNSTASLRAVYINGTSLTGGDASFSFATNDIIGIAFDASAKTVTFYKNGSVLGSTYPYSVTDVGTGIFYFMLFTRQNTGTSSLVANFGQRPFSYTPPSGFKALNTYNLPAPSIANGAQYMAATTYTGSASQQTISNSVNGVGFQPDLVWAKSRSNAFNHALLDVIRGGNYLSSNTTTGDTATSGVSFVSNGVTWPGGASLFNDTGLTYVAWQWKGGGTGVSNTSGTITSTVSASPSSGFSIATYTGNGSSSATVGHGLNSVPSMIICKGRSYIENWWTFHQGLGSGNTIQLDTTAASVIISSGTGAGSIATNPTSSVFGFTAGSGATVNNVNQNGETYVAYCFSAVSGYSAFGKWTGNGSSDGPFVFTNFRPRYVMWKRIDVSGDGWWIVDSSRNTYNVATQLLFAQSSTSETAITTPIDFLSNGFKLRNGADGSINGSGGTYIYMAFAENPFSIARAR